MKDITGAANFMIGNGSVAGAFSPMMVSMYGIEYSDMPAIIAKAKSIARDELRRGVADKATKMFAGNEGIRVERSRPTTKKKSKPIKRTTRYSKPIKHTTRYSKPIKKTQSKVTARRLVDRACKSKHLPAFMRKLCK